MCVYTYQLFFFFLNMSSENQTEVLTFARQAFCLSVLVVVMVHHDHKQLGKERVYFVLQLSGMAVALPSPREVKAGSWREELEQEPWRSTAYWLTPCGLFSLLGVVPRATCPRGVRLTENWSPPNHASIKKTYHKLDHRP